MFKNYKLTKKASPLQERKLKVARWKLIYGCFGKYSKKKLQQEKCNIKKNHNEKVESEKRDYLKRVQHGKLQHKKSAVGNTKKSKIKREH